MKSEDHFEPPAGAAFKTFLAALREIGWSVWDPIGLSAERANCVDECVDEYDGYLLAASGKLANGASEDKVADYLVFIENGHMGMPKSDTARNRAFTTARRISALIAS